MVEYALLLAGSSLGTLAVTVNALIARVDWTLLSYLLLAVVAIRIAIWAFRSPG